MGQSVPIKRNIVLVEDEPLLRMAVDMVEGAGFEVVEAVNADEGVRILERRDGNGHRLHRPWHAWIDQWLAAADRDRWPPIEHRDRVRSCETRT